MLRRFLVACEKGGVEDGVDFPLGGNVKVEHHMGDGFFDLKRASPFHLEFLGSVHVKVGGFKPDLVSYFPWGVFGGYPLLHPLLGQFMSSLGIVSSGGEVGESVFQVWQEGFAKGRVGPRFIAHHKRKWSSLGDGVSGRVVSEFCHGKESGPFFRFMGSEQP